jgi:hypothetical protein
MLDLSDEEKIEFYEDLFDKADKLESMQGEYEYKYKILKMYLNNIKLYESTREHYNKGLDLLWKLKKNYAILLKRDKENLGVLTNETEQIETLIQKNVNFLNKQSKSFKEDLEKIIKDDPEVKRILYFGPN